MSSKDAWNDLYRRHWSLVPLKPDKKCYISWRQYQAERAGTQAIREWLKEWPEANPGVVTGRVSGIVVIDVDGPEGLDALDRAGIRLKAPVVNTARGYHYYFAYPDIPPEKHVVTRAPVADHLRNVDVRGDGGYVVGPGGKHESGAIYEWAKPPNGPLPQLPEQLLELVVSDEPDTLEKVVPLTVPADRLNGRAKEYVQSAVRGEVEKIEKCPDGSKHGQLLRSAIALAGFVPVLSEQEIEDALYNAIAPRAKDKRGARITIRDGISYGSNRPRSLPEEQKPSLYILPQPSGNGVPADGDDPFAIMSLGDYFAMPEEHIEFVVEDMLTVGGISAFGAKPKVGKSTLARVLALNVARGDEFLGRQCRQGNVIYWALEEQRPVVLDHFKRLGARPTDPIMLQVGDTGYSDPIQALGHQIQKHKAVLAVVDPFPRFIKIDPRRGGRDMQAVYEAWLPIVELARNSGCHIAFLMHTRKGQLGEDPFEAGLDMLMDSIGNAANIDTGFLMIIQKGQRVGWTVQRTGANMEPTVLNMDEESGRVYPVAPLDEYRLLSVQQGILRYLDTVPGGAQIDDICKGTSQRRRDVIDALRILRAGHDPIVVREGLGRPRHPYLFFKRKDKTVEIQTDEWELNG